MQERLNRKLLIYSFIFCVISMAFMFYTAQYKVVRIQNVAQDQVVVEQQDYFEGQGERLNFITGEEHTEYLCIPIPKEVEVEDVCIENHYMERELWIEIKGVPENFYEKLGVYGNLSEVSHGYYKWEHGEVSLKFQLKGLYESKCILEDENIYIEFFPPKEMYEKIVVIDPAYGGEEFGKEKNGIIEKEVTLEIVKKVKDKLDDSDIKVYYTRMEDQFVDEEKRVEIANDADADFYIRVALNSSSNLMEYGTETLYNGNFFIPEFGSLEFADLLEKEVVLSICGKGNGLFEEEDPFFLDIALPAANLKVGYISNYKEATLLGKEEYQERVAEGIVNAINRAYEDMNR